MIKGDFRLIANYHTHTYRCHHAIDREEEYIINSINNGIKILGFSDHAPFRFPDGFESNYRVQTSEAKNYFCVLNELRRKYKQQIEIHIGFEMEYYPLYFDDMLNYVKSLGAEYLILGQHFIGNEYPNGKYVASNEMTEEDLTEYVDCVVSAIKTGKFTYIAHPDVFKFYGDSDVYYREMKRLCVTAKKHNTPLEINFLGIEDNRHYPNSEFWKIAGEVGNTAIFGCDAHTANDAFSADALKTAKLIALKNNITVLEKLELKPL